MIDQLPYIMCMLARSDRNVCTHECLVGVVWACKWDAVTCCKHRNFISITFPGVDVLLPTNGTTSLLAPLACKPIASLCQPHPLLLVLSLSVARKMSELQMNYQGERLFKCVCACVRVCVRAYMCVCAWKGPGNTNMYTLPLYWHNHCRLRVTDASARCAIITSSEATMSNYCDNEVKIYNNSLPHI